MAFKEIRGSNAIKPEETNNFHVHFGKRDISNGKDIQIVI